MKYRITHPDKYNWDLERFEGGGELISRGRYVGQEKKAKWVTVSHHGNLRAAAKAMLTQAAGDALLAGEAEGILEALTLAEERVMACLAASVSTETEAAEEDDNDGE
jgi:hypothetical protein